jgi:hypothetical protein
MREVLKIGKMADGEPYFAGSSDKDSIAIAAFEGTAGIEEKVLSQLQCKPGDRVECFVSFKKIKKARRK